MGRVRTAAPVVVLVVLSAWVAGLPARAAAPARVPVVAAEEIWGSIARQLGGERADVTSIITDPNTDPHDYEARPSDGAAVARARVAIVNGIGYDGWMSKLLAANASSGRRIVAVGDVAGVRDGGNPHQWYAPRSVSRVIDAITEALKAVDPAGAAYFDARRQAYRADGLKRYDDLRAQIRARFAGVAVGASESIVAPLAEDLGLDLVTPESFLDAVSEGNEPTARDKATVDAQITGRKIEVFVYNAQNSTPDVEALVAKARKAAIPVTTVTETPVPAGARFEDWQARQLEELAGALAQASSGAPARPAPTATTVSAGRVRTGRRSRSLAPVAAVVAGGVGIVGGAAWRRRRRAGGS
jgi:zinc/manganese transport system substrate-binding protein